MPFGIRRALLEAYEISRLARVTSLDRVPLEVVAAVRPSGHVLQVTQGKGTTLEHAAASAVGEAAELWVAERGRPLVSTFSHGADLEGLVLEDDGLAREWGRGRRLSDAREVWVASERVCCPPAGARWLGPSTTSWSSNGFGAHSDPRAALEHAVLEVWERHALARAVPGGWTAQLLRSALVDWRHPLVEAFHARGFWVAPALLARRPLVVAGVLVFDLEEPGVPLTAGYACRRTEEGALLAALLEAGQSRLTEIHGARDDVATGVRADGRDLLEVARAGRGRRLHRGAVRGWPRAIAERIVVVELTSEPLTVVKAIGIGLEESELLR